MAMNTPNILWICTDQQRYDTIGALGNPHVATPNIDSLVAEGVAFTHAYCQHAESRQLPHWDVSECCACEWQRKRFLS